MSKKVKGKSNETGRSIDFGFTNSFAKIIATENISIRQSKNFITASFDINKRILNMPIWTGITVHLYDMLLMHEVGHALDTPSSWTAAIRKIAQNQNVADNIAKHFLNVVEDNRVDRRQKTRYPGCIIDYAKGNKELLDRDFYGISDLKDINSLSFIDRLNLYSRNGSNLGLKFNPIEEELIRSVESTETFEDVVKVTKDVLEYSKKVEELYSEDLMEQVLEILLEQDEDQDKDEDKGSDNEQDKDDSSGSGSGSDNEQDKDDSSGSDSSSGKDEDQDKDDSSGSSSNSNSNSDKDEDQDKDDSSGSDKGSDKDTKESLLSIAIKKVSSIENSKGSRVHVPTTIEALNSRLEKLATYSGDDKKTLINVNFPLCKLSDIEVPYTKLMSHFPKNVTETYLKFRDSERRNVSYMVSEFERKKAADIYRRTKVAKTGVLNMNDVHQYKFNDDIFKRQNIEPEGKNHGLVFFLDWSGSMRNNIIETIRQLLSLTMFCKMVNIPFEVYIFQTFSGWYSQFSGKNSDPYIYGGDFHLKNIISSKMNAREYQLASSGLLSVGLQNYGSYWDLGGTPLNSAALAAPEIVNRFIRENKVQVPTVIFLTDGQSDGISISTNLAFSELIVTNLDTKRSYATTRSPEQILGVCLKNLSDVTGASIVGIHINNSWTNGSFIRNEVSGYKSHYTISSSMLKMVSVNDLLDEMTFDEKEMKNGKYLAKISQTFSNASKGKKDSRLLLKFFIDDITGA